MAKKKEGKFYKGKYIIALYTTRTEELQLVADNPKEMSEATGIPIENLKKTLKRVFKSKSESTVYFNNRICNIHLIRF